MISIKRQDKCLISLFNHIGIETGNQKESESINRIDQIQTIPKPSYSLSSTRSYRLLDMGVGVLEHMAVPDMVLSALADHHNLVDSALVGFVGSGPPASQAAAEWTVHSRL